MNFQNISAWSIRNPVIPLVFFTALMLAGILSFARMDVVNNPDVEFPAVNVQISQPGAAPTEIENQITQRVESAVSAISGVKTIDSTASEGSSSTFIEFEIGLDANDATAEVKNAVDSIRGDLPDGILEPRINKVDISGGFLGIYAVEADDMTIEQLSWFIDDTVTKRLQAIEGMAEAGRFAGVNREIEVILDLARMQAFGVTASQINNVLRQSNIDAAGGATEIGGTRQSVRVLGGTDTAFELSQQSIQLGDGRTIRLADVADVRDGFAERSSISRVRDQEVVNFSMSRAKGASDVTVYDEALEVILDIEAENPGVRFIPLFNTVDYTKEQYTSSMKAMIEGAILAVIVVFFFLRDWRATLISSVAIPLSAIPTFWFMDLLGFNLNQLSLLALALVAGVLVDDAIVEIENIVRHMRMGKTAYQASIDAADEIGLPVVATSFCIVAVFLPVGLMPGFSGQFFKNFGITVVVAVLMSLAVARMITPMLAAYFLRAKGHASHGEGPLMDRYIRVLNWTLQQGKAKAMRAKLTDIAPSPFYFILPVVAAIWVTYEIVVNMFLVEDAGILNILLGIIALMAGAPMAFFVGLLVTALIGCIPGFFGDYEKGFFAWSAFMIRRLWARFFDHRVWMLLVGFCALMLTVVLFAITPAQFQPVTDNDNSRVEIEMVPGTTLATTERVASDVAEFMYQQPEVELALERVRVGRASLFVTLRDDREKTSVEFERGLAPMLAQFPDARVRFASQSGGFGSGRDMTVMLAGSNPAALEETATELVEQMRGIDLLVAPRISADINRPEIIIKPRASVAAELGVTTSALSQTIRIATLGEIDQNAAKFSLSDRQIPIRVKLPAESRESMETLENLPVPTRFGSTVPLSRVAEISFGSGPTSIQRYNQNRRVLIGADLAQGVVSGDAQELIDALPILQDLPQGVTRAVVGEEEWQAEMIDNLVIAIVAGFFLVFAVLVLLYKRLMSPLVNMTSLLLAPLGGIFLIWAFGQPQTMAVYIGVLLLLGIVSKNSILLIDFAIEEMATGTRKFEAIMEAGHKRAQPIVMTTVAMTAGMVPTALSGWIGSGDGAFRAPMGMMVIGGLIASTVLTLVIVPAGFSLADGIERRLGPWLRDRMLTYRPGDDGQPIPIEHDPGPDAPFPGLGGAGSTRPAIPATRLLPGAEPAE